MRDQLNQDDLDDLHDLDEPDAREAVFEQVPQKTPARVVPLTPPGVLRPIEFHEFLAMDIKPRRMLVAPVLPTRGIAMIYAPRGVGKTYLANALAYSASSGEPFLRWTVPEPVKTLLIDGEMPDSALKERFAAIDRGSTRKPPPGFLRLLAADLCPDGIPNLSRPDGQKAIEPLLQQVEFLILDNLSCLAATSRDNDADSWSPVQEWLLRLRRQGKTVLLVHHAGKGGQQRGSSRREDILDTVIALKRPSDYLPTEGARFEVHIEKARHVFGDDAKPFEARLETRDGAAMWTTRDLADVDLSRVIELAREGLSVRDIAEETGLSKSTVQRLKQRAVTEGLVSSI